MRVFFLLLSIVFAAHATQKATSLCERIRVNIESFKIGVGTLNLAEYDFIKDLDEILFSDADEALYKAKKLLKTKLSI